MDTDSSEKLQQSVSSVPKALKSVTTKNVVEHNDKQGFVTTFELVVASGSRFAHI